MKKCLIFFFLFSTSLNAQEFANKIRPLEFTWQLYACTFQFRGDSYSAFQKLLPSSTILANSANIANGYSLMRGTGATTTLSFCIGIPITIFKTEKFKNIFRFGYDGLGKIGLGSGSYEENRVRLDSTYYPQYNTSLMKDSIYIDQSGALLTGNIHQIKTDLLFRFRLEKRFKLYTGMGAGLAIMMNRKVDVVKRKGSYSEVTSFTSDSNSSSGQQTNYSDGNSYYYYQYEENEVARESFKLKNGYSLFAYVPFGIDWRIGNKSKVLKRFHLFTEGQIGARFSDVYLNTRQTTFYFSTQLGVRIAL